MESWSPYFTPAAATVTAGSAIRWENPTGTHHTITHDGCLGTGACAFDSGSIGPDGVFEISGLPPGLYPYHCTLHPIMRGDGGHRGIRGAPRKFNDPRDPKIRAVFETL